MSNDQPTPERIMQFATGYWATGLLGAAASLSVFTHLEGGADTADRVAAQAGISARGAQTLLDGLVGWAWPRYATAGTATPPTPPPSWSTAGPPA